jgi:hypothetical protein
MFQGLLIEFSSDYLELSGTYLIDDFTFELNIIQISQLFDFRTRN